jgi:murein endopeptidase
VVHRALSDQAVRNLVDDRVYTRRAEVLVKLAPARNPVFCRDFEEVIVAPRIAARECLDVADNRLVRLGVDPFSNSRTGRQEKLTSPDKPTRQYAYPMVVIKSSFQYCALSDRKHAYY